MDTVIIISDTDTYEVPRKKMRKLLRKWECTAGLVADIWSVYPFDNVDKECEKLLAKVDKFRVSDGVETRGKPVMEWHTVWGVWLASSNAL